MVRRRRASQSSITRRVCSATEARQEAVDCQLRGGGGADSSKSGLDVLGRVRGCAKHCVAVSTDGGDAGAYVRRAASLGVAGEVSVGACGALR
eukprot:47386-Pleurochrysis_carterae.AAC.1